jgi:hypothetical protein
MAETSPGTGFGKYPWIVEFRVRAPDERQIRMMNAVGPLMFFSVAELWLRVMAPDARILEEDGMAVRRIEFPTRALARKFVATWSGKVVSTLQSAQ